MIPSFKHLFQICSLLLFILFAQSCEKKMLQPELLSPQPALLETNSFGQNIASNCNGFLNEGLAFPLDIENNGSDTDAGGLLPAGYNYNVFLGPTSPYDIGTDCLCRVQSYTLQFNDLSQVQTINVVDATGVPVPFSLDLSNNSIAISSNYVGIDLSIGFVPVPGATVPALLAADGFCIVDNISTPHNKPTVTEAYIAHVFNPITMTHIHNVFVPVFVATAFAN